MSTPRPCPVCASQAGARVLHRQRFEHGVLGDGYQVVVCDRCGAAYAEGIPSQADLDAYYADRSKYVYDHHDGLESPYDFGRFEAIAAQICEAGIPKTARILDVGCATGGLLARLKARGYVSLLGADPSPACARAAGHLHGIEVKAASLSDLKQWTGPFDLILLVGVLEHLGDVHESLLVLEGLLAPGGSLYCAQPDVAHFRECRNAPYQQFSMEHVNFFSERSLGNAMARCRLEGRRVWHWMTEWRKDVTDSVLSGLFSPAGRELPIVRCEVTAPSLTSYLEACRGEDRRLADRIRAIGIEHGPILVWGAGALTRRMFAEGFFSSLTILAIVDQDPHARGVLLGGREVVGPADIADFSSPILISSQAFAAEIRDDIRGRWKLGNPLIDLVEPAPGKG